MNIFTCINNLDIIDIHKSLPFWSGHERTIVGKNTRNHLQNFILAIDGIRGGVHLNRIGMDVKCAPWECGVFEYMPCTPGKCGVFQVHHEPRVWEDM